MPVAPPNAACGIARERAAGSGLPTVGRARSSPRERSPMQPIAEPGHPGPQGVSVARPEGAPSRSTSPARTSPADCSSSPNSDRRLQGHQLGVVVSSPKPESSAARLTDESAPWAGGNRPGPPQTWPTGSPSAWMTPWHAMPCQARPPPPPPPRRRLCPGPSHQIPHIAPTRQSGVPA